MRTFALPASTSHELELQLCATLPGCDMVMVIQYKGIEIGTNLTIPCEVLEHTHGPFNFICLSERNTSKKKKETHLGKIYRISLKAVQIRSDM